MLFGWFLHTYDFKYNWHPQDSKFFICSFPSFQVPIAEDLLDSYIQMPRRQLTLKLHTHKHHLFPITDFSLPLFFIFINPTQVSKLEIWRFFR